MGSIYLIRHGQASFGAGDYDVLSATGHLQAQALGGHFLRTGVSFDRCIAGSLRRQQDTAVTTLAQLGAAGQNVPEIETDPAFNELDAEAILRALLPALMEDEPQALHVMGNPVQNQAEFQRLFALVINRWVDGRYDNDRLQSWPSFVTQVEAGLQRTLDQAQSGERVAVFTSGGTITALLHLITRIPAQQAFELSWQIVNSSCHHLKFRGREVALASFNDTAHLQLMNQPELITYR